MPSDTPQRALEAFASKNPELERLEQLLTQFNLFEAIGVVRQETRHSNFLAFLLDPRQNHGLGTIFLQELLQAVLLETETESAISPADLTSLNLSQAVVEREWRNIDILVVDEANRFGVIIENKIDSGERSDQLKRYYDSFQSYYPGYKVIALYLTLDGDAPSFDIYHAVSYQIVCEIVEKIAAEHRSHLNGDVVMVLEHYAQMLRRHILSESVVADLCRSIYSKHKLALDLIFEHRPDHQAQLGQYVKSLILEEPELNFINEGKHYVNFGLNEWDTSIIKRGENGNHFWLIWFSFHNYPDFLKLELSIGLGNEDERKKLLQMVQKYPLMGAARKLGKSYCRLTSFSILQARDYEKTQEEIETLISEKWDEFRRDELPRIALAIRNEEWLWKNEDETPC